MLRLPYGVVGAISPFTSPSIWSPTSSVPRSPPATPPVVIAGQTSISSIKLAEILLDAGLPGLAERRLRLRCRGRQRDRRKRRDRGDHLHRVAAGRLGDPLRPPQEGQPRARLHRAADRPRGRRLGDRRRQGEAPRLLACGPELHLGPADPRSIRRSPRGSPTASSRTSTARHRRSDGREHRRRPTDQPQGPRPGQGVGRRGREDRRDPHRRGTRRRGPMPGADRDPRALARFKGLVRRDLRPGCHRPQLQLLRRGDRARQRLPLRPPGRGLHPRLGLALEAGNRLEFGGVLARRGAHLPHRPDALRRIKESGNTREAPPTPSASSPRSAWSPSSRRASRSGPGESAPRAHLARSLLEQGHLLVSTGAERMDQATSVRGCSVSGDGTSGEQAAETTIASAASVLGEPLAAVADHDFRVHDRPARFLRAASARSGKRRRSTPASPGSPAGCSVEPRPVLISSTWLSGEGRERLDHPGHQRWLCRHLPASDRDRPVEVGARRRLRGHELNPRHPGRLQHPLVRNAGAVDHAQELRCFPVMLGITVKDTVRPCGARRGTARFSRSAALRRRVQAPVDLGPLPGILPWTAVELSLSACPSSPAGCRCPCP